MLICLAAEPRQPRSVAEVRETAVRAGLRAAKKWDISKILSSAKGEAIRTPQGWELTDSGRATVAALTKTPGLAAQASTLRSLLPTLSSTDLQAFVAEAIGSVESGHYRAAVVLSWVGAVGVLYDYVVTNNLAAFNSEASRRDAKWKAAKTPDDLARMKEYDFLQVLESISVIGKNVKIELEGCLKLRNGCGHPSSLRVAEHRVNSHIETLVLNVYGKFA